jgi:glycine oxidase
MLAPVAEAWPGEESLLELGTASLRLWPEFAERLAAESGRPSGLRSQGTLVVGADSADRAELDTLADYLLRLGRTVLRHSGRELRKLEPSLGPAVRGGLEVPGDLAVDNRVALAALRSAAEARGVEFVTAGVHSVRPGAVSLFGRYDDLKDSDLKDSAIKGPQSVMQCDMQCDAVVIAAGARSGALHPALRDSIRPVKGEILRVRSRGTALPPPSRTIRGPVHGRQVYLVPRDDGLVIGATQYEVGFDGEVTVGGVRDLISDAERLVPGIAEYALAETAAGFRPSTEDNLPLLGWLEPGVLVATGHYRNGFLLAPITADVVVGLLRGEPPPVEVKAADPSRWRGGPQGLVANHGAGTRRGGGGSHRGTGRMTWTTHC